MTNKNQVLSSDALAHVLSLTNIPTAVYISHDLDIQLANDPMIALWGKDRSVIGKTLADAVPELRGQPFLGILQKAWETGEAYVATNTPAQLNVDGKLQTFYFDFEYRPLLNQKGETYCILHNATNVTARYLAKQKEEVLSDQLNSINWELTASNEELSATNEELVSTNDQLTSMQHLLEDINAELRTATNNLQRAIDLSMIEIWNVDLATGEIAFSERNINLHGIQSQPNFTYQQSLELISPLHREKVNTEIQRAIANLGSFTVQFLFKPLNGERDRWVKSSGQVYANAQGEPVNISGVMVDITEQKEDEQRKNDFIGIASHELKTPLTTLKAYVQMLKAKADKNLDKFNSAALGKVDNQVNKMTALINGFLNIAHLEAGKIQLVNRGFDLEGLIGSVIDETKATISSHNIIFHQSGEIPVTADQDRIEQVISNLLSNAIKYSPKGSTINISCENSGGFVKFSVCDEGIGINPHEAAKLFERFYRVKNSETQNISGFGIGLYLSHEIIKMHHGDIGVDSEPGKGSSFWFTLPL